MESVLNIDRNYADLTHKQKEIVDYLLANPENACYISLSDLSARTSASEVTILRMCKKLGFGSYVELKKAFRKHTEQLIKNMSEISLLPIEMPSSEPGDKAELLRQICQNELERDAEFYKSLCPEDILAAARRILAAKRVLVCGHSISKVVADFLCRRLLLLEIDAVLVSPEETDNVQANLLKLRPGDNLIAITFPRYYAQMGHIVQYAESRGATVTAITDRSDSPAVTSDSLNFLCPTSTKMFYNSLALPIALVNMITSGVVIEMGPRYDRLIADANRVADCLSGKNPET